jgi:peroxiredoxin Q/BCP
MTDWLEAGQQAADFTLCADDGIQIKLASLRGNPVVVYFYPKDDTPGCTREACAFRDLKDELKRARATVIGISPDAIESHADFRDKYRLNFPLLADPDHKPAEKYGAWRERNMYGKKVQGIQRSTFLIDRLGKVARFGKTSRWTVTISRSCAPSPTLTDSVFASEFVVWHGFAYRKCLAKQGVFREELGTPERPDYAIRSRIAGFRRLPPSSDDGKGTERSHWREDP